MTLHYWRRGGGRLLLLLSTFLVALVLSCPSCSCLGFGRIFGLSSSGKAQDYTVHLSTYDLTLQDVEKATQVSLEDLSESNRLRKSGARTAFVNWQSWIGSSHPSDKCRKGAKGILESLDALWPSATNEGDKKFYVMLAKKLRKVKQCGEGVALDYNFSQCKRYTCALWQTFHSLSFSEVGEGRGQESFSGEDMMNALKGFIDKFFTCSECREHFLEVLTQDNVKGVKTRKDFAMWLWEAHNVVNRRLAKEEAETGQGDPSRPKHVFPHSMLCPECYLSADSKKFDREKTYTFLKTYYNFKLPSKQFRDEPVTMTVHQDL